MKDKVLVSVLNDMVSELINNQRPGYDLENRPGFRDPGSYPFIPMQHTRNIQVFLALKDRLRKIKSWSGHDTPNPKFLDAGCGPGNVLVTAKACCLPVAEYHGIEYFDETYKRAVAWLGIDQSRYKNYRLFKDDILKFNGYYNYDIIYYYCPFSDGLLQRKFEERLEDEMKVGAILLAFLKQSRTISKDSRFEKIEGLTASENVFIKVKAGERGFLTPSTEWKSESGQNPKLYREKYGMK